MDLVERVKKILVQPSEEWQVIQKWSMPSVSATRRILSSSLYAPSGKFSESLAKPSTCAGVATPCRELPRSATFAFVSI